MTSGLYFHLPFLNLREDCGDTGLPEAEREHPSVPDLRPGGSPGGDLR